ncbi:MAG: hypothetical protein K2Z81_22830, partial [Cyanobacteria bacterium]|nr:hypothetical protein [Cyanobacteriota bacterium]
HFVVERICSLSEGSEDATSHSEPDSTTFFRHAIDPQSIGAYGHSLGGTAAAELPNRNHRCRATANMHGWFPPHASREERYVEHTFLYLVPKLLSQHHKQLGHFKDGWQITIDGFLHQYFGDVPLYAGPRTMSYASDLFRKKLIVMPLPGSRAINITSASLVAFFNHHLRNQGENLSLLSKEFGEITVEKLPD